MSKEIEVVEDNRLVELVSESNALTVFLADKGTQPYLDLVRQEIDSFEADVRTSKGKKAIASMAAKISKIKVAWDNLGKEEVARLKEQPKIIDAERKRMRDTLDAWKEEVRKPLTDFEEAEKKRVHHIKDRIALLSYIPTAILSISDIEILIAEKEDVNVDTSFAEFQKDAELEKLKTIDVLRKRLIVLQEREEEEKQMKLKALEEQREREKRLINEAEERAKAEAEAKAAKQIEDAKRAELNAKFAAEEAQRREKEAEELREKEKKDAIALAMTIAEERRQMDLATAEKEKQEALALAESEKKQAVAKAEKKLMEKDVYREESKAIEVKVQHINEAVESLVDCGIDDETACDIIDFIYSGFIAHVKFVPDETLPF